MTTLDYLNKTHPVRRKKSEKNNFRSYVIARLSENGIAAREEKTKKGKSTNIIIGNPESARTVFTAHYDTPASSVVPNLMMPRNPWLVLFFHLIPIFLILTLALVPALIISKATEIPELYPLFFLLIYFSLFYLLYFAFTNRHNYNDNTSGVATLIDAAERLAKEDRSAVAFILFDNEEKGLIGSKNYFRDHKDFMKDKLVINFDCVGNGDNILFIAKKKAGENELYLNLMKSFQDNEKFTVLHFPIKGSAGSSDHKSFPLGIACMAASKTKRGIYFTARIHTKRDVKTDADNIDFLSEGIRIYAKNLFKFEDKK